MALSKPLLWTLLLLSLLLHGSVSGQRRDYKIGFLLPFDKSACVDHLYPPASQYAQAILIAMEDIRNDPTLNVSLTWVWNDTKCDESLAIRAQAWQMSEGVDAFIGPGFSCTTTSRNAVAFNKPVISYQCADTALADKKVFKTVARTSLTNVQVTLPLLATLKNYNWKRVAIVVERKKNWQMLNEYISKTLAASENNITVAHVDEIYINDRHTIGSELILASLKQSIKGLHRHARVVILLMEHNMLVEYMLLAYREGLVQTGEYVFISFELDPLLGLRKVAYMWYFSAFTGLRTTETIMKSFEALLVIQARLIAHTKENFVANKKYEEFSSKVRNLSLKPPFKSNDYRGCLWHNTTTHDGKTKTECLLHRRNFVVPIESANLYHAIRNYAYALNSVLAKNMEPNGDNIIAELKGHSFDSIYGFKMTFDNQADLMYNLTLLDQHYVNGSKENTRCEPFVSWSPCMDMQTMADFWPDANDFGKQVLVPVRKKVWFGGSTDVPLDTPKCGFNNEFCEEKPKSDKCIDYIKVIGIVSGLLALLLLVLLYMIYRRYSMEKQPHNSLWKYDRKRDSQSSVECEGNGSLIEDNRPNSIDQGKV